MNMRRAWTLFATWFSLNLVDAAATIYAVNAGYTGEVNPLCVWLLARGATAFFAFKAAVGTFGLVLVGLGRRAKRFNDQRTALVGLWVCVLTYSILAVWHLVLYVMTR